MTARIIFGAVAALAFAGAAHADLVNVGTFANVTNDDGDYQGDYGTFVSWATAESGLVQLQVDVTGLLDSLGYEAIAEIRVIDTGLNTYGAHSSGADIDLFSVTGLWADVETSWYYDGPTPTHIPETSAELAQRVAAIDAQGGVHEWGGPYHVALGYLGTLGVQFSQPQGIHDDLMPGLIGGSGEPILLHLREAGVGESFRVEIVTTSIPAPGGLALLGVTALLGRRRRRS